MYPATASTRAFSGISCYYIPVVEAQECSVDGCSRPAVLKGMCNTHYQRQWRLGSATAPLTRNSQNATVAERFWSFVTQGGADECWPWRGTIGRAGSYGILKFGGKKIYAHRVSYELLVGPVPDGMTLDHLCHTRDESCLGGLSCLHRRCVNPAHLEPVSGRVNRLRGRSLPAANAKKTHCAKGHPYDEANTYVNRANGARVCRTCNNEAQRAYQQRKRERRMD